MKKASLLLTFLLMVVPAIFAGTIKISYTIDVTHFDSDSFFVDLDVSGLSGDSAVFQFASTAPGTYQVMNVGRFVGGFSAFDAKGKRLEISHPEINQFVIRHASDLARVTYQVDDSYGTTHTEYPIYLMCGSNLERDNALVNGQMVCGYFHGFQSNPIEIKYTYPKDWKVGTALEGKKGSYYAETFDQLVDSPFMLGPLTHANTKVGGANVDLYCYSPNGRQNADSLLASMKDMLESARKFLGELPVKRYAFLYHFRTDLKGVWGAWEHSYSSEYVTPESTNDVVSTAAHEFFHIVTPLNIHSEIIESFNYIKPVASQHLWLYEGTTEWASDMMQVRGGLMNDRELLGEITKKLNANDSYDPTISLVDLSLGSYDKYVAQYENIYEKGALTAMFLDTRLLELSKGKTGLRDVINKFSKKYGPHKAFPESEFFNVFVKETFPEIKDYFDRYVKGTDPLPVKEYLAKAGYDYIAEVHTGKYKPNLGKFSFAFDGRNLVAQKPDLADSVTLQLGIQDGDAILRFAHNGKETKIFDNLQAAMAAVAIGDRFSWIIERGGKEMTLSTNAGRTEDVERHKIVPMSGLTKDQEEFRKWWLTNR